MMEFFWATNNGVTYHMFRDLNFLSNPVSMCGKEVRTLNDFQVEGHSRTGRYCAKCNQAYLETVEAREALRLENGK